MLEEREGVVEEGERERERERKWFTSYFIGARRYIFELRQLSM